MRIINNGVTKMSFKKIYWIIQWISATCQTRKKPIWGVCLIENCFAEYTFVQREFAQDEVQCAHWNSKHVTIHPSVIYFKHNNSLAHKSVVYVCDKKSLSASII